MEKKYTASRPRYSLALIKSIFSEDPAFPENYVFNIYFDTPSLDYLYDKLNGDFSKQKIRIRWYGEAPEAVIPETAKLECKIKKGAAGYKNEAKITMPSRNLHSLFLAESWKKILAQSLPGTQALPEPQLAPVMLSRYRRRRFIDPHSKTRISFDDEICSLALSPAMLNRGVRPTFLDETVIEVKNETGEMPHFLKLSNHCRASSFSKYALLLDTES